MTRASLGLGIPMPRLLPLTIMAMAALLGVKSVALVRAAAPAAATEAAPAPTVAAAPRVPVEKAVPDARPADPKAVASKPGDAKPGDAKAGDAPPEPPISESERALLLDLRKRREELDARAAEMTAREGVLAAAEARLAARMSELAGLQKRLESLEAARQAHDDANWQGLVKLYESMKPKDAAAIFSDLDLPVLLPVLDRMKDRKAALVLAAMSPDRARMVTAELARMRARANDVPPPPSVGTAGGAAATPPGKTAGGG